jgi:hypothetical protein
MNTKRIGERSEGQVLAALLKADKVVLMPFGDNQRYDFVIDEKGGFRRIQVKTGRLLKNGAIRASTTSSTHRAGKRRGYVDEADYFAIYCPENDKVYMMPVHQVGQPGVTLWPKSKHWPTNTDFSLVHIAETYEFRPDYNRLAM